MAILFTRSNKQTIIKARSYKKRPKNTKKNRLGGNSAKPIQKERRIQS
jgi:hypothetical protein